MPYGVHTFPFSFTLAYNIPSSFESKDGQVRYEFRGKNLTIGKNYTRDRNVCPGLNLFQPGVKRHAVKHCISNRPSKKYFSV